MDQNDNRPVFRQEVFTGHVLEGAVPGAVGAGPPAGVGVGRGCRGGALGRSEAQDFPLAGMSEALKVSKNN